MKVDTNKIFTAQEVESQIRVSLLSQDLYMLLMNDKWRNHSPAEILNALNKVQNATIEQMIANELTA